jgi:hypothetical protein
VQLKGLICNNPEEENFTSEEGWLISMNQYDVMEGKSAQY